MLHRVFDLRQKILTFLSDSKNDDDANLITMILFINLPICRRFDKLSNLNISMQGSQINIQTQNDKLNTFMKNLQLRRETENLTSSSTI